MKILPIMLVGGAAMFAMPSARADVTFTLRNPELMAAMAPDQRKAMADVFKMLEQKIYLSGTHYRMDMQAISMITDSSGKQMTTLLHDSRTYSVEPIKQNAVNNRPAKIVRSPQAGPTGPPWAGPHDMDTGHIIVDTGKTTQFHGHTCRHYIQKRTVIDSHGPSFKERMDILAAQDIKGVDPKLVQMLMEQMRIFGKGVKGIPLETVVTETDGSTKTVAAEDISTAPIPAATFQAPAGYRKVHR
jgi:hypothetical protein